jgi:hypothetical protein
MTRKALVSDCPLKACDQVWWDDEQHCLQSHLQHSELRGAPKAQEAPASTTACAAMEENVLQRTVVKAPTFCDRNESQHS